MRFWADFAGRIGMRVAAGTAPRWRRVPARPLTERPLVWLVLAVLLLAYVYPAIDVIRYSFTNHAARSHVRLYFRQRGGHAQPGPCWHPG